ncbi:bilirubin reductase, long form [Pusillimonas sp. ANT_WB101]|uniref:bilirubin reductase, long form n=1 Tax=Pusillimonas sp. ANT_WB101 TaxID=2597356 RepID=UPI0011EDB45D|nr:bilirubin reductase, long form [Pusillimonas sp. ANT_WB101]KAA0911472.1 FAD-dependent oxidoreductase [Pusillimonas sp. ANT_WB101]
MKLLEPISIGGITFKNRVMFPPLTTGYEAKDGSISAQSRAFYTRLAEGGTGYIVLGDVAPIRSFAPTPKLFNDSQIKSFRLLADNVHAYGAKLGVQIFYPEYDVDALNALFDNGEMDNVRTQLHHDMHNFVNDVSEATLMQIIDKMCACAVRAQKAGVDVVQVHGDRLVGALCSTQMNQRADRYGGSLQNRTRFALLLVRALKRAVPTMILDYKLSVVTPERGKGGVDEVDAPQFAKWLEEAGVDMLHVGQANHTGNMADTIPPMGVQPYCFFADITGAVKEAVSIPVSTSGRIIDPEMGEGVLQSNKADMIGIGRALLADPYWANKAAAGKALDIVRCISCNEGCVDAVLNRGFIACVVNPENGFEETRIVTPAKTAKNVVIIGGGPAGLEAARVAAKKGHSVTLFEKEARLGGQLNIADVPPRKIEIRRATEDLVHAVRFAGVVLRLGETATQEGVLALAPDVVILAVGASSFTPPIPGVDGPNVRDAWKVLAGAQDVSGRVAVVGGGVVGCETAELLGAEGYKVSIVEMQGQIASGMSTTVLPTMLENYKRFGVEQYTGHKVLEVAIGQLICTDKDGRVVKIPCDSVVIATGARPVAFQTEGLINQGIKVVMVGDCRDVADISHATKTAYDAANAL